MFTNLIKSKKYVMNNLLEEIRDLSRLQGCLDSGSSVYMVREYISSEHSPIIAYLTGDYIALYDESEFESFRQNIDFSECYVVKLDQDAVLTIAHNLLDYKDDDELLSDDLVDDSEYLERCEEEN